MAHTDTVGSDSSSGWSSKAMSVKLLGGSLVSWAGLGIAVVGWAITYGATQASFQGGLDTLRYQVNRNYDDTKERFKSVESSITNIYTAIAAIHSIKTDVEVIKTQMKSIDESIRRMERSHRNHHMPR